MNTNTQTVDERCNAHANTALYFAWKLQNDLDFVNVANARDNIVYHANRIIMERLAELAREETL